MARTGKLAERVSVFPKGYEVTDDLSVEQGPGQPLAVDKARFDAWLNEGVLVMPKPKRSPIPKPKAEG